MSPPSDEVDPDSGPRSGSPPSTVIDPDLFRVDGLSEAELIDRIVHLESLQNAVAAAQSEAVPAFARSHAASRTSSGTVEPEKLERGIAAQIASVCRVGPTEGRRRVRTARDLHDGLDHLRGLFTAGELSTYKVSTVVTETAHLDSDERAEVDHLLVAHHVERMGVGELRGVTRSLAAQVGPEKFRARATAAARTGGSRSGPARTA